jgi:hypothetical protein
MEISLTLNLLKAILVWLSQTMFKRGGKII